MSLIVSCYLYRWVVLLQAPAKRSQHAKSTLLGATCCVRLATMLRRGGCCWLRFDHFQIWANNTQHIATHRKTVTKRNATCCAQQCCDMLRWHVEILWPGLYFFFLCALLFRHFLPSLTVSLVTGYLKVVHDFWFLLFSGAGAEKLLKFKKWLWSITEKMSNSDRQDLVSVRER